MKKLILPLLILIGMVAGIAPLRAAVLPRLAPVYEPIGRFLHPAWVKVRDPLFVWSTKNETKEISGLLHHRRLQGQQPPDAKEFRYYLEKHDPGGEGLDPWGKPYFTRSQKDSVYVVSAGPDGRPNTADDVRSGIEWRNARGR